MISRVADHCFWLGRYIERSESSSRVLRVGHGLALDGELPAGQVWATAITVSGEDDAFRERFGVTAHMDGDLVQNYLTWTEDNPASIKSSVAAARENCRSIREVISLESWEAINGMYLWLQGDSGKTEYQLDRDGFYRQVRQAAQLTLGTLRNTMLHDNAFDFITLGLFLERAGQTARILDVHHHVLTRLPENLVQEESLWLSLLRACSGFEPFMKRSAGRVTPRAVAEFLILEPRFPRSILFCVRNAVERLGNIRSPTDAVLPRLECQQRLSALEAFASQQTTAVRVADDLHGLLTKVVDEITAICGLIGAELLAAGKPKGSSPAAPATTATAQSQS